MSDPDAGLPVRRSVAPAGRWTVESASGRAGPLHQLDPPPARPACAVLEPTRPALVLGSAQADDMVDTDRERSGIDVVRRRTGGGAVYLEPADVLWVDFWIGRGDPLWDDDVGRAFAWLGSLWAEVLGALGVDPDIHRGRLRWREAGSVVCFAGLGPGELTVDGRKVVGLSQRRDRSGARFQSAIMLSWDDEPYRRLLGPPAAAVLTSGTAAVPGSLGRDRAAVLDRLWPALATR